MEFFFLAGWIGGSFWLAHFASKSNNRSYGGWLVFSLVTSPLIALIALAMMGSMPIDTGNSTNIGSVLNTVHQARELLQNLKKQFNLQIIDEAEYNKRKAGLLEKIAAETDPLNHDRCINQLTECVEESLLTAAEVKIVYNKFQEAIPPASDVY